jgi:hypothetical protein
MKHPKHVEAKQAQEKWLNGYQVIVSEAIRTYGGWKDQSSSGHGYYQFIAPKLLF